MKNVLKVNYNNQVTVRLSGVAELLGTNESNLKTNLNANKDKFIEGKDYYKLSHEDANDLRVSETDPEQVIDYKGNHGIQLWTQSGLAMHAKLVLTGYAWDIQRKLVDNFFGHKEEQPKTPQTYIESLQALIESEKEKERALLERDVAIETKAEIGHRREATAMNTASQQTKKANKLEIQLDESKEYCTIKRMEMIHHGQKFNWRLLKSTQKEMGGKESIDVYDANYGTVKAYHIEVWTEAYSIGLE